MNTMNTSRHIDLSVPRRERQRPAGGDSAPPSGGVDNEIRGYTSQLNVTSVSQLILPANPKRKFLFIQNNDLVGAVNMSFGVDATLTTGMRLSANGGGILLDNNVPTSPIYMIGSIAANSNVTMISG